MEGDGNGGENEFHHLLLSNLTTECNTLWGSHVKDDIASSYLTESKQ